MREGLTTGRGTQPRGSRRRGFTLVELVVVLSVMLLAAVVAVPSFLQFHRANQLRTAAMRTLALAAEAHGLAVSRDAEVRLVYDPAVHGLRMEVAPPEGADATKSEPPLLETVSPDTRLTDLPLDVQVHMEPQGGALPAEPVLRFYGDGSADPARLELLEDGFPPVVLETNPRTGRVHVRTETGDRR